jgi:hypothetical protein
MNFNHDCHSGALRHGTQSRSERKKRNSLLMRAFLSVPLIYIIPLFGAFLMISFSVSANPELDYPDPETGFFPILAELNRVTPPTNLRDAYQKIYLPPDEIFQPLTADPKEHQFFASIHQFNTDLIIGDFTAATVGFGERFGLYRWQKYEDAWQISIAGGLFAQFDLNSDSSDLINADYLIGLNLSRELGKWYYRYRLYHQSTHLGDEFILRNRPDRINFHYEKVDATACYQSDSRTRLCAGAGYMVNVWPREFQRLSMHLDGEYRSFKGPTFLGPFGRYVSGIHFKLNEQQDWSPNVSVKTGVEFGESGRGRRRIRILFEGYYGYVPFGQFFDTKMNSLGVGVYLGF